MAFNDSNSDKCLIYGEAYYEEVASEEEVYLEETEEKLRTDLLSLVSDSLCVNE
jgi:hypothetical protein